MWSSWDHQKIVDSLPNLVAVIDSNTQIFSAEYHEKNRSAITSLTNQPLQLDELRDDARHRELTAIGFALDICGRRASQQGEINVALELLHASHEIFRCTNSAFKPSKPMRQVVENAIRIILRERIDQAKAGHFDAAELRDELGKFVIAAWGELPPQFALLIDEFLMTGLEEIRADQEDDSHFQETLVRTNIDTVLKLDIPTRLQGIRKRWEEIGQHIAPNATRIAARELQRPTELGVLLSADNWRQISAAVERGDNNGLVQTLGPVEDILERNLRLRLDAKPEFAEPTSELRMRNVPDPTFVRARELLAHQEASGLEAFRSLHYSKGSNAIVKEWYAYALARVGRRTDIHEIIGVLEDAISSSYYRSDIGWSARWNLACALRRLSTRSEEALSILLPLLENDIHTTEIFELCLLWALEAKNEDILRDLLPRSIHYEAHLLAALRDLEVEPEAARANVHFRRLNHILGDPNHVFPEPKERLWKDDLTRLTREFSEHSLLEAGIEWFRQRLAYGHERIQFKNWESMARLYEEAGEYKASWRCREQQWRVTARNPRLPSTMKISVLKNMLTWGQRHGLDQQALALLNSGWRDAGFNEGDVSLWEQQLNRSSHPSSDTWKQKPDSSRLESPPQAPAIVVPLLDMKVVDQTIQQFAGSFYSISTTEQLSGKSQDAEQLVHAVRLKYKAKPPAVFDSVRAVVSLAVEFGGTISTSAAQGRLEEFRSLLETLRQHRDDTPYELFGLAQACERVMQNLAVRAQALPEIAITPPGDLHIVLGRPPVGVRQLTRILVRLGNPGPEPMSAIEVDFISPSKGIYLDSLSISVPELAPGCRVPVESPVELDSTVGDEVEIRILVRYRAGGFTRSTQAAGGIRVVTLSPIPPRYVTGGPVSTDRLDLFHGRERELSELQRAVTAPKMLKLYFVNGIRAVGKSTLMQHLGSRCSSELIPVLVPLEYALGEKNMTPMQLVRQFCRICLRDAQNILGDVDLDLKIPDAEDFALDPPWVVFEDFLENLHRQTARRILLCIDEMQFLVKRIADPSDPIDEGFLGWLRDKIQTGSNLRVVCTGSESFGQLRRHHEHVVWRNMEPYNISFVDRNAMEMIATIPVKDDGVLWLSEALDCLWDFTEGHPCVTQILAERAVELIDREGRRVIGPLDIERAYAAIPHDLEIWELWWNEREGMIEDTHRQLAFLILRNQPASRAGLEEMALAEVAAKSGIRSVGRYLDEMRALEVLTAIPAGGGTRIWRVRGGFLERYLAARLQRTLQEVAGAHSYNPDAPLAIMLDYENVKIGLLNHLKKLPSAEAAILKQKLEGPNLATALLEASARFGSPRQRWAVADWDRPLFQGDQKAFKMARYSTDIAGHSEKNSSDHVLREKIHFVLREHPEIGTFVIGTGDADFHETIKTLQEQGKHVVLWSTREQVNRVYGESLRGPDRIRIEWLEDLVFADEARNPSE